jgi:hypothetical protein
VSKRHFASSFPRICEHLFKQRCLLVLNHITADVLSRTGVIAMTRNSEPAWPFEGLAFDIEKNAFWVDEWGPRPLHVADAVEIARKHVSAAPTLIPIYSHRYLPADPSLPGNPVFSVYQSDIIVYGRDLWDYFRHEFQTEDWLQRNLEKGITEEEFDASLRKIPFWTRLYQD